jgi:hypothetical protein
MFRPSLRRVRGALVPALLAALACPPSALADASHDHGTGSAPVAADADRCDLGFNTKPYNDLVRAGKENELTGKQFPRLFMQQPTYWDLLTQDGGAYNRWFIGRISMNQMWDGRVKAGHGEHPLTQSWTSLTDPVVCNDLKQQLLATQAATIKYPTLGDAVRAGFTFVTPWFAGGGTHMGRWENLDDKVTIGDPDVLIYDGNDYNSHVVGAMYTVLSDQAPKKVFAGGNDEWHQHRGLCFTKNAKAVGKLGFKPVQDMVIGGEAATDKWCKDTWGGRFVDNASLWMMHVWIVPGCGSDYGMFSHDLPYLTLKNMVLKGPRGWYRGCGKNIPVTAPTSLETNELNIPGRLSTYRSSQLTWSEDGQVVASGPGAIRAGDHPGAAHPTGEIHTAGTFTTEAGFSGPAGEWKLSVIRNAAGVRGSVTTPNGTVATFSTATTSTTGNLVTLHADATTGEGRAVTLSLQFADPAMRGWFADPLASGQEMLAIHHPAHGHDHAAGPVQFAFSAHPGENHGGDTHILGTATTQDGFTGDAGAWTVSLLKSASTGAITGYLKNPAATKQFNFTVTAHHAAEECPAGVHIEATGAEAATPTDPQNPELVICDPEVTALLGEHTGEHAH